MLQYSSSFRKELKSEKTKATMHNIHGLSIIIIMDESFSITRIQQWHIIVLSKEIRELCLIISHTNQKTNYGMFLVQIMKREAMNKSEMPNTFTMLLILILHIPLLIEVFRDCKNDSLLFWSKIIQGFYNRTMSNYIGLEVMY